MPENPPCWDKPEDPITAAPECDPCTGTVPEEPAAREVYDESPLNIAKDDAFLLVIELPGCLLDTDLCRDARQENIFQMGIVSVNIPTEARGTDTIQFMGRSLKLPNDSVEPYEPITVEFIVDSRWERYKLMKEWLDQGGDPNSPYCGTQPTTRMTVYAFNGCDEEPMAAWTFEGAYPINLSQIQLDSRTNGEDINATVTFEISTVDFQLMPNV